MVSWELAYAKQALKDAKKVKAAGLKPRVEELLAILEKDPFQTPPMFEKLVGDLAGAYPPHQHPQPSGVRGVCQRARRARAQNVDALRVMVGPSTPIALPTQAHPVTP